MTKKQLIQGVETAKDTTAEALLVILNALNQGQRKKISKDERVAELLDRYGIEYED